MKIALFIKPFTLRVVFSLVAVALMVSMPGKAHASFFSDLFTKVVGSSAQAADTTVPPSSSGINNSQTIPLLESSINPDLNAVNQSPNDSSVIASSNMAITNDGSLDVGTDSNQENYDSSVQIHTYTVKAGDTLGGIAEQFGVSEKTLIAGNADLKKSDLIKVGQTLIIFPTASDIATAKATIEKESSEKKASASTQKTSNITVQSPATAVTLDTSTTTSQTDTNTTTSTTTSSGQPSGTIAGNYRWPFDPGVGRVSQGLHADQAYDFAAPLGTPIHAVQSGTILITHTSGYNGGYGLYVVENFDDGRQAIYGHMSKVIAVPGQVVKQGDIIGLVGSTGNSTGPHVHIGFHGALGNPYIGLKVNSTSADLDSHD
jgi:murein DD-endopeptidase MepM/ murein hydrolase activator NlpD